MGLPGDGPRLELTYNHGVDAYELGTGYNHIAITAEDLDATLERAGRAGASSRRSRPTRARGRLPPRLRPRSGRLPDRAHRDRRRLAPPSTSGSAARRSPAGASPGCV
jgi:hypothetical protein